MTAMNRIIIMKQYCAPLNTPKKSMEKRHTGVPIGSLSPLPIRRTFLSPHFPAPPPPLTIVTLADIPFPAFRFTKRYLLFIPAAEVFAPCNLFYPHS